MLKLTLAIGERQLQHRCSLLWFSISV